MALEIEHKYLVTSDEYRSLATAVHHIRQGYLSRCPERTVRVRVRDDEAFLTVKGINRGAVRQEFEWTIPLDDAVELLGLCEGRVIDKTRFLVPYEGHLWEVDEFAGDHAGLVLAEVELDRSDEPYERPPFVGDNVTDNPAYYNVNLT